MNGYPPAYFVEVRNDAARRWRQLEEDPILAAPWHQLFKQVQSPRHVLSELLQNADDAGATEAMVFVRRNDFVFEHNGRDFTASDFSSLCRFGYSNKRALHTIGFRGIGFKSVFSLGDQVELTTPTLSVVFEKERFTLPVWNERRPLTQNGKTAVRVQVQNENRLQDFRKNLDEWLSSPVSLLFFRNLRRVVIDGKDLSWKSLGPGPVSGSEWFRLYDNPDQRYLYMRSAEESFPEEALEEIRQERMVGIEEGLDFPPCSVEIVLDANGRLYVVLPTGVVCDLPFACNAPFIQDPGRMKIKDPEISPTNRWLLQRCGALAGRSMVHWLANPSLSLADKADAYRLMPNVDRSDRSLEGECARIVEEAFEEAIAEQPILLAEDGSLRAAKTCVLVPQTMTEVWPAKAISELLDDRKRPIVNPLLSSESRKKLLDWDLVDAYEKNDLCRSLRWKRPPKPKTWRQLLKLWAYLSPAIGRFSFNLVPAGELNIIPVQGQEQLFCADEVVRLGDKKILRSEDDWKFLANHLMVLNQNWTRFLAEQKNTAGDEGLQELLEDAYFLLRKIHLDEASDVSKIFDRVATKFFSKPSVSIDEAVKLAHIGARLGVTTKDTFQVLTRDGQFRSIEYGVYYDSDGKLEEFLPEDLHESNLLHPAYDQKFDSCSADEWWQWIASGRSGLLTFVPLKASRWYPGGRNDLNTVLARRGYEGDLDTRYSSPSFEISEWDFGRDILEHWETLAEKKQDFWKDVLLKILDVGSTYWEGKLSAIVYEQASNGHRRVVLKKGLAPAWILRLQDKKCLPDTHGFLRKPAELFRRTPQTEPLQDVEAFVRADLDTESNRPLFDLLGVSSEPTGPGKVLSCLRALAKAENPPAAEVDKWYRRLDQMMSTCSTEHFNEIVAAFRTEKLILTQGGGWADSGSVFLASSEEDVPDADVVRRSVSELTLWRKLGVADRPTLEKTVEWLHTLPSRQPLEKDEVRRVRSLLRRYPREIWHECAHWLNLANQWVPVGDLSYALCMQSLTTWSHLDLWVKGKTADFQFLPGDTLSSPPFQSIPPLASRLDERFSETPKPAGAIVEKAWITSLGKCLSRISFGDEPTDDRIRNRGRELAQTAWQQVEHMTLTPYLDGTPAGVPRQADVVWLDRVLYVSNLPLARLAKLVPEELNRKFGHPQVLSAISYAFERDADHVVAYMEENFDLRPPAPEQTPCDTSAEAGAEAGQAEPAAQPISGGHVGSPSDDGTQHEMPGDMDAWGESGDSGEDFSAESQSCPESETGGSGEAGSRDKSKPEPKLSLFERYLQQQGFRQQSEGVYGHPDGHTIARAGNGAVFPWELRDASGNLVKSFWFRDHCLETSPLQLNAELWHMLDQHPEQYVLVLADPEGNPREYPGEVLRRMKAKDKLRLHTASYRLVHVSR